MKIPEIFQLFGRSPDERKISIAIAFYNRSKFILGLLEAIINDDRIDDIVINDDLSSPEEFDKMSSIASRLSPKIRIFENDRNCGAFKNKYLAISRCKNEWAICLDSDNSLNAKYINKLFSIKKWDPEIIYCPDFARPRFNFKSYSNLTVNMEVAKKMLLSKNDDRPFRVLLNTGNFFVPTKMYANCVKRWVDAKVTAADVFAFNYLWLKSGHRLFIVKGMEYDHRMHSGSFFANTSNESKDILRKIRESLIKGLDYQFEKTDQAKDIH